MNYENNNMSWKVTDKTKNPGEIIVESLSGGLLPSPYKYTIENEETGECKTTRAHDNEELAENIKNGKIH
jgi:hypothetical protein